MRQQPIAAQPATYQQPQQTAAHQQPAQPATYQQPQQTATYQQPAQPADVPATAADGHVSAASAADYVPATAADGHVSAASAADYVPATAADGHVSAASAAGTHVGIVTKSSSACAGAPSGAISLCSGCASPGHFFDNFGQAQIVYAKDRHDGSFWGTSYGLDALKPPEIHQNSLMIDDEQNVDETEYYEEPREAVAARTGAKLPTYADDAVDHLHQHRSTYSMHDAKHMKHKISYDLFSSSASKMSDSYDYDDDVDEDTRDAQRTPTKEA